MPEERLKKEYLESEQNYEPSSNKYPLRSKSFIESFPLELDIGYLQVENPNTLSRME
jgi:hypothetical protein